MIGFGMQGGVASWWCVTFTPTNPSEAFVCADGRRVAAVALAADLNTAPSKKVIEQTDYLYSDPDIPVPLQWIC